MKPQVPGTSPVFELRAYLLGADLTGRWSVDRKLVDRASGTRGTFTGVVRFFEADDGGLRLHEEGTMRWPSFTGPASRDYLLRPAESSDAMVVFFPDGRPFHRMSFAASANEDQHWCDPDTYRVNYTLHGPDSFGYCWDVQGPRKDLLLETVLQRQPSRHLPGLQEPGPQKPGAYGLGSNT
ncbi:DUF6314 family protein [Micrococcaceae bacterium Sec5.7]